MNYGPVIFLAAFFALAGSWFGFVLTPQMQVGHLQQTNTIPAGALYPVARPGLARQGLDIYRANGCAYCHSQQVGQIGTVCDVLLTDAGTNQPALLEALLKVRQDGGQPLSEAAAKQLLAALPKPVLQGVTKEVADTAVKALAVGDAKPSLWLVPVGSDIARGWGLRHSVAEDFLFDDTVMLGSQRIGPDLANVGVRLSDPKWHLLHLYAPRSLVNGSTMPPYRFLFEKRRIERAPTSDALPLPAPPGYEIVPKPEAKALAAYLASLRADAPLWEAPVTVPASVPPADTNAPAGGTAITNSAPTNPPAK
ncbi:MAG TPA: cbb3-type cytochrome c oxidase subunit II [Candidatus Binatia bacterium]|jgi:cbb3-type cytochrome oxidase cytochrome c subunit|nr:cbb3-type cytochrome c oxidase subunit II [Candidatus Binatia bacterium]